ncbi:MAG: hypothetical protein JWP52_248, partial [Rhizobacter sp.]|nr:hypothetical protein [Rhizobacter sp.]
MSSSPPPPSLNPPPGQSLGLPMVYLVDDEDIVREAL